MTKFDAQIVKPVYAAAISLGTSTAGSPVPAALSGQLMGTSALTGSMTVTAAGAVGLSGTSSGTGSMTGSLTVASSSSIVVSSVNSPVSSWDIANLATVTLSSPLSTDTLEIAGAPAGFAIAGVA